uniref:Uncharacterized protein n=1 Tax=Rhizophora mucronata TaxID=61149 RepID=A0A2P2PAZ5_RHIMU
MPGIIHFKLSHTPSPCLLP